MMHPDPSDLGLVQDGLELVAEEYRHLGLITEISSEVGEQGVCHYEIQLGSVDEASGVGQECITGTNGFGSELQVFLKLVHLIEIEPLVNHPSERFREIALVVLCLNDSDLQWLHRFDAEEVETEAPPDDDLHHQG